MPKEHPVAAASAPAAFEPLSEFDPHGIRGVLTDIDDTLTRDGRLPAEVYSAIARLVAAGIAVVPVTGRSAGWAHLIAHHWPVEAVVAESGGLCLHRDGLQLRWTYHDSRARISDDRARLAQCAQRVLAAIPTLRIADDNAFRLVDYAIDHAESVVPAADPAQVAAAIAMIRGEGFQARASSVHINAWCGDFDKAPMARHYLEAILGLSPAEIVDGWCFIGDAPNDESMFAAFPRSVGVANLAPEADRLTHRPRWLTTASHGEGFTEFAEHLIAGRQTGPR
jgi:HAD superfamily hydrolase (TIGR01484 family)